MSLRKIIFSTAIMSAVRAFRLLAQFVAVPILSRLLSPTEYGLVALAMPFALFAMMIADAGIGMSLVRTPANDRAAWSGSFWLVLLFGLVLALLMAACGPLAAYIFHEPALTGMVAVLSFVVLAQSIHLIPMAALQQAGRFRTIATVDIVSTSIGIGTAVYMAYHSYGAWALIGQQVMFFATRVVMVCWLSPFRPLFLFDWEKLKEHVLFGRNVLGINMVNYCARSLDSWVVGKALGAALLGIYTMAFQFARLPTMLITGPLQYVMYSQLASLKNDEASIGRLYMVMTRMLALLLFPAMGMVAVAHGPVFTLLLSSKWEHAGYLFMLLAPATALQAVVTITETICYALGRTELQLRFSAQYALMWIGSLAIAARFGLEYAALAFFTCVVLYSLHYLRRVLPIIHCTMAGYLNNYLVPLSTTFIAVAAYLLAIEAGLEGMLWQILTAASLSLAAIAVGVLSQKHSVLAQIKQLRFGQPLDAPPPPAELAD